jgi:hypothetical protein
MMVHFVLIVVIFLKLATFARSFASSAVCVLPSGLRASNVTDCSSGEVFLIGRYVHLGIHNVASFGTNSVFSSTYYNDNLGFIVDYDQNGFDSSGAGFSGDFFVPGAPVEGML